MTEQDTTTPDRVKDFTREQVEAAVRTAWEAMAAHHDNFTPDERAALVLVLGAANVDIGAEGRLFSLTRRVQLDSEPEGPTPDAGFAEIMGKHAARMLDSTVSWTIAELTR